MGRVSGGGGGGGAAGGGGTYGAILRVDSGAAANDVDLTGLVPGALVLWTTSGNPNVTGFLRNGFADGQWFDLINVGGFLTLFGENAGSAAANRFSFQSSGQGNVVLIRDNGFRVIYDGNTLRWRGLVLGP